MDRKIKETIGINCSSCRVNQIITELGIDRKTACLTVDCLERDRHKPKKGS